MDLLAIARWVPTKRQPRGDDGIDRLHHLYTPVILSAFTVLISMQQYVGDPISCWIPDHFTGSHKKYATSYCWVKNTYYLPLDERIPRNPEVREEKEIVYYQWLPFLLIAQAVFFYLPHTLWSALNSKAGVDADNILETSDTLEVTLQLETRETRMKLITNQLHRFVSGPRARTKGFSLSPVHCLSVVCCCICGKRFGNYLTFLYLSIKLLYIGNVVFQLFALGPIFKTSFHDFGWDVAVNAINGEKEFTQESIFPRVTMCDFVIRRLGNNHRYTMQCVLPVNMFSEKMYIFIWFWFMILLLVTTLNLFMWAGKAMIPSTRKKFILNHLQIMERLDTERKMALVPEFVNGYLKQDGVFILRLIGHNTSQLTSADITATLWDSWLKNKAKKIESRPRLEISDDDERRNSTYKPPLPLPSVSGASSRLDIPDAGRHESNSSITPPFNPFAPTYPPYNGNHCINEPLTPTSPTYPWAPAKY